MKSGALGKNTSGVEISNISSHGIWLFSGNKEFFLSYDEFPWFKDVAISRILNVEEPMPGHFFLSFPRSSVGMHTVWGS